MPMDCSQCLSKCQGECCSNVPMTKEFMAAHKPVREIIEMVPMGDNMVVARTASGRCPFLSEDFRCTVYRDRPRVCQVFGDESTIFATCSWQSKDGRIRSRQEKRMLERKMETRSGQLARAVASGDRTASHLTVQERERMIAAQDDFYRGMGFKENVVLVYRGIITLLRKAFKRR